MVSIKNSEKIKQNLDKVEMLLKSVDKDFKEEVNMFLWNINKDVENIIKIILEKRFKNE